MGVLMIVGYGPGISQAVAVRFAREGYRLALVARRSDKLEEAVTHLAADGILAGAYPADASDPEAIRHVVASVRRDLGPVSAVVWTAFRSGDVRNVLETRPEDVGHVFDVGVAGLLACVQEVLEDLKSSAGSVLVANGALGENTTDADRYAKYLNNDGVALENSAKSKLVGVLAERLREFGIYVGEVTIAGSVSGTATADPSAIPPERIANEFWSLTQSRDTTRVRMTP
jgi:NAD(P)-dependent dehydrogenase (short-subunit alcohol dehydrogenase family)